MLGVVNSSRLNSGGSDILARCQSSTLSRSSPHLWDTLKGTVHPKMNAHVAISSPPVLMQSWSRHDSCECCDTAVKLQEYSVGRKHLPDFPSVRKVWAGRSWPNVLPSTCSCSHKHPPTCQVFAVTICLRLPIVAGPWFSMLWSRSKMRWTPLWRSAAPAEKVGNTEAGVC